MATVEAILSEIMDGDREDASTLPQLLCASCADSMAVTGVGMALMSEHGHEGVVGATDGTARAMEDLQFTLGEGPCMDASSQGSPVLQPDLSRTSSRRWPGFGPAMLEAGVAAIFALPLQVGGIRLGVLDLYRDTSGQLREEEMVAALVYADAAVIVLLHLEGQMEPGQGVHPDLVDAVGHRPELHQATGMVSVQAAVGLTEALLLLRAHAFATETPILAVARAVVARRVRFDLERGDDE